MELRDQMLQIIKPDLFPSVNYWCSILDFFERNKTALNVDEIRVLAEESERCRMSLNQDTTETISIQKNGKNIEQQYTKCGLNIKSVDVNPNIPVYLNYLEHTEENKKETRKTSHQAVSLAAKSQSEPE